MHKKRVEKVMKHTYYPARKLFQKGDKVRIVADWDWVGHPVGTIMGPPRERQVRLGVDYEYYVLLDTPAWDTEGEGPFRGGIVLSGDLELVEAADPEPTNPTS